VLNKSKLGPLILIDPITPGRNAGSALSESKYLDFKNSCKKFIKKPDIKFFERIYLTEEIVEKKIHKKGVVTILFSQTPIKDPSQDKRGTRMHRQYLQILNNLKSSDFEIIKNDWDWDTKNNALFFLQFDNKLLPKDTIVKGPPIGFESFCKEFKRKYSSCYEKNGMFYSKIKRKYREPVSYIREELFPKLSFGNEIKITRILK